MRGHLVIIHVVFLFVLFFIRFRGLFMHSLLHFLSSRLIIFLRFITLISIAFFSSVIASCLLYLSFLLSTRTLSEEFRLIVHSTGLCMSIFLNSFFLIEISILNFFGFEGSSVIELVMQMR